MNNKQKLDHDTFKELISITSEKLKLPQPYVIEKDYYVTQAIFLVTQVENEVFELIFQGGTFPEANSLGKGESDTLDKIFNMRLLSFSKLFHNFS